MCTPLTAEDFDGGGSNGLFLGAAVKSGWQNDASTQHRELRCPVPYEFDPNDTSAISVRVHLVSRTNDVFDGSLSGYDSAPVRIRSDNTAKTLRFDRSSGFAVLEYTLDDTDRSQTGMSVGDIRFLELNVTIPDKATNGRDVTNGLIGYRVFRGSP